MSTKNGPKGKGTENKGKAKAAPKAKRVATAAAPEAVVEDVAGEDAAGDATGTEATEGAHEEAPASGDTPFDADAPVEGAGICEPAPKRKRDMTIDDLRAEYVRVIGRETASTERRYLLWKLAEAAKGRIPVGPVNRRAPREKADLQVLPLGMLRETTRLLDEAVKACGYKSRMAFIRQALVRTLRYAGSSTANAAADAIEAESAA